MLVDRALPGEELIHRQPVAFARFLQAEQSAAYGSHHLGLAPDDPALGVGRGKIGDGQRAPIGTDDIANTRPVILFGHLTWYYPDLFVEQPYLTPIKIILNGDVGVASQFWGQVPGIPWHLG